MSAGATNPPPTDPAAPRAGPPASKLRRAADFLGLRRGIVGLLSMVVLVGMGERFAEDFLPIYIAALGGGAYAIGLLNALDNLLGALYSLPGGWLSHRWGIKRALLIFNVMSIAGFALVIVVPTWQAVIFGSLLFLSWSAISLPASMDLVATALPKNKRTMGVSIHSLVRRIPMALGPICGGALIDAFGTINGVRIAFVAAIVLALVALLMQQALIENDHPRAAQPGSAASANPLRVLREMSPALRSLLVSDVLIRFCEQIPYAFVVVWCMQTAAGKVSGAEFGVLRSIEMATAVLAYIPVAFLADRAGKRPFVLITFGFFTIFPLVLLVSHSFWTMVAAFVIRGLKEFGEPTRKALILDLAPAERKAITFGVYYLVRDCIVSVAAFGGAWLWTISPATNLIAASAFGLLGTVWFWRAGADAPAAPMAGDGRVR